MCIRDRKYRGFTSELLVTFPTRQKRLPLISHSVRPWLCYWCEHEGTIVILDHLSKVQVTAYRLLTANAVHQLLFFDCEEVCREGGREGEESLKEKATFVFAMQDHAIVTIDYYSLEEKLIKANSETKRFTSIAAFNETKLLIGCEASAILLWDVNQWNCHKVVDKSSHQSRPIVSIKSLNDYYQRVVSISDNGTICVWDASKTDGSPFKLLQAVSENTIVSSCDVDNWLVGLCGQSGKEVAVWNVNSMKRSVEKVGSLVSQVRFFPRQALASSGSCVTFIKTNESYKDAVGITIELKDIDPSFTTITNFVTTSSFLIAASQTRIFKLDFTKLFQPKILSSPHYTTTIELDAIKSCISDQGIITKESPKDPNNGVPKKFFYTISSNNLYCTMYSVEQKKNKRLLANKIISMVPDVVPSKIGAADLLVGSEDGRCFALRCGSSGTTGVWSLKVGPIFSIQSTFMDTCLSFAWHSNSKL
eukprot:TRINITY_DN15082_c0_g1_i5.p1 TRINITY_DN15082_c0_g1~~TRINITY_DN15082_c0_g1_i5.p1  ORF type:complete len:490 (-),score=91.65 TRINITY_DN15082_c0_g1_i5:291-1721(-)